MVPNDGLLDQACRLSRSVPRKLDLNIVASPPSILLDIGECRCLYRTVYKLSQSAQTRSVSALTRYGSEPTVTIHMQEMQLRKLTPALSSQLGRLYPS